MAENKRGRIGGGCPKDLYFPQDEPMKLAMKDLKDEDKDEENKEESYWNMVKDALQKHKALKEQANDALTEKKVDAFFRIKSQ